MEKQDLYEMCKSIIDLNKQRYVIIKNEIEDIIRNNISDNMQIERKLDEMLDILLFYETDDSLRTFKKLCKYYFYINPQVTIDYINYYREPNAPEGIKLKNKKGCKTEIRKDV